MVIDSPCFQSVNIYVSCVVLLTVHVCTWELPVGMSVTHKTLWHCNSLFTTMINLIYTWGDCIGLPIGSTKRFPVIPTYGLHELTGWTVSGQELLDFQAHPVGAHLVKKPNYAMPRALLKYSKAHDTPESSSDRISLQFLPAMGPSSLMYYTVEMTKGFKILVQYSFAGFDKWYQECMYFWWYRVLLSYAVL